LASDEAHAVDPKDCGTCKSAWIEYRRDNGLLRPHSITQGRNESERLNRVVTFGGSSLSAADPTDEFLRLANSARNVQYAPGAPPEQRVRTGQGAGFHFGRGRVVMLADTNTVAAQALHFTPDSNPLRTGLGYDSAQNRQLILNIVHWLSGLFD